MKGALMKKEPFSYKPIRSAILLLFLLFFIQTIYAATAREKFVKSISFMPGGFLSLSNTNGNVQVSSWESSEVEIIAYKEVKAADDETAEKMLKKLLIDVRERDGEIIIETDYPKGSGGGSFFSWLFGGDGKSFSVQYEIKVPHQIDLNLSTTNGNVEVEEIIGKLRLESTNGRISADKISGLTRCHTTNGSIDIEFREILGDEKMSFKSTNGSIKLYLPGDFSGDVDLKTTNGRITCDFPLQGRQSRTHVSGEIGNRHQELSCRTTNGNIGLYKR
jgi:DUF4097 and DUF4098 domain-containing protein YvlB